jgi:DNA polymerase-1
VGGGFPFGDSVAGFDLSIPDPVWVDSELEARRWITRYLQTHRMNGGLGLDTETTGLDKIRDSVVFWSLSDGQTRICLDRKYLELFREPILENPEVNFDLTNAKFDAHMLKNSGIDISKAGDWRDTVVQSWLRNENNMGRHGLKECTTDLFGRVTPTFEETFGKIPKAKKGEQSTALYQVLRAAIENSESRIRAVDYASLDAYNSTMVRHRFDEILDEESVGWGSLKDYFYRVEVPFSKVLWKMERRGITTDKGYLMSQQGPMEARMEIISTEFNREFGDVINLKSTAHMRRFFFDHLKKDVIKETKGGTKGVKQPSTDAEVLEIWAGQGDPWAQKFLEYRGVAKIHGTYVSGLQQWLDANYRIHTSLNQVGTVTGRLSSSEPNLQNLPRPDEDEFKIREAFIGGERKKLLVADYEQLEMRLMAHFSGDPKMIQTIIDGKDLHSFTTAEMEGIPYDDVAAAKKTPKGLITAAIAELLLKRQNNKGTGFGIIYGIGGPKLAAKLTRETKKLITEQEGWGLIKRWLGVFPGVEDYIERTKLEMRNNGFVRVITGRKRRFGDVRNMNRRDAAQSERQAVNSIIQGTAAEMAKMAMIMAEDDSELRACEAAMLLQVHDELVFEVPDDEAIQQRALKRVKEIMEHPLPYDLYVPTPVSAGIADTWASAK